MDSRHQARPVLGIALKVASTLILTAMATLIKVLSERYPVGELAFFRSAFALPPVLIWAGVRERLPDALYSAHMGRHIVRSVIGTLGMFCGFSALALLPIADAIAIAYAAPLLTVVFAAVFLGETVRMYRWSAVLVGFVGVLIILSGYVAPSDSENDRNLVGAGLALAGAVAAAIASTQVRVLTRYDGAVTIVIYFSAIAALGSLVTVPFGWTMPTALDMGLLVLAGILGGFGQVLLAQSFRYGEASTIAPFDYTSIIWTLIASVVVFGMWPRTAVLVGTAVVVGAGLFVIYREHRLGIERTRSKRAQTPTTPLT